MSKKVLLIKMTSMGDLIHTLPALTDAANVFPEIRFEWVADEVFAEIPHWHPAVDRTIKSAHRRWRKNLGTAVKNGDLKTFYQSLNQIDYDAVIDCQNNLKGAFIALLRRIAGRKGPIHGLDKNSVKEKPAHWVYQQQHFTERNEHAITHQRRLMSLALGYPMPTTAPDYGIDHSKLSQPDVALPERYVFFVHNASWSTKLWPESHWQQLIDLANQQGYSVLLPCGNQEEKDRAERLAKDNELAIALPLLPLSEVAAVMDKAAGAVCCDTGLGHLAAALDLPSVSFYGPTDAKLIGAVGLNQHHIIASSKTYSCAPCYGRTCTFAEQNSNMADCMASFSPQSVWDKLQRLIK